MKPSSQRSGKFRMFVPPRLVAPTPDEPKGSAAGLWQAGEAAEEAYDFESAHLHYRAAVRATPSAGQAEIVLRYASFLVERFGQYGEVAAWLDDSAFHAPEGREGAALLRLLGRAARETAHPRQGELAHALADAGDPDGVLVVAQERLAKSDWLQALALLEQHPLPPLGPASQLRDELRQRLTTEVQAALGPAEAALGRGELELAQALLQPVRARWPQVPAVLSLAGRLTQAEVQQRAGTLRVAVAAQIAAGDWPSAEASARALAQLPAATEADRGWLAVIAKHQRTVAVQALLSEAEKADDAAACRLLARLLDRHGGHDLPALTERLAPLWSVIGELAPLVAKPLEAHAAVIATVAQLRTTDDAGLRALLATLPASVRPAPSVATATSRAQAHAHAALAVAEAALVASAQHQIDAGDLEAAATALHGWMRSNPALTPAVKAVRQALQTARQTRDRITKLRAEFEARLGDGGLFAARAALSELGADLTPEQRAELQTRWDAQAGPQLRGKPMPPGLQKLAPDAPIATGIAHDRLVLVQERIWLAVNLETGGLQPFALPDPWPVQVHAWTRIGPCGDRVRLAAVSGAHLVVVEQQAGQPPAVVAAAELRTLLRGDDQLLGAALEPDARAWRLLTRHSQRGPATTLVRVDPVRLEVLDWQRAQPHLASLTGVRDLPEHALTVVAPKLQRELAVQGLDGSGGAWATCSAEDVGESVAGLRRALAWPDQDRVYASFDTFDPFGLEPGAQSPPSLLVLRGGRVAFASADLRRRFAPKDKLTVDHAWTLDAAQGRLWFAARSAEGEALVLGVDARTLRADAPVVADGVERVLALEATPDGAVGLARLAGGGYGLLRARLQPSGLSLTSTRLPL